MSNEKLNPMKNSTTTKTFTKSDFNKEVKESANSSYFKTSAYDLNKNGGFIHSSNSSIQHVDRGMGSAKRIK